MDEGFPAITTKKLAFKSVVGELIGFIRGYDNAAQFRELGCNIWDQNANENAQWLANPHRKGVDDLGAIYGVQWRRLPMADGWTHDQLAELIHKLRTNPSDRRLIVWAFNPAMLHMMALPPCHMGFQCFVDGNKLSLKMEQRSVDTFLGLNFNISSYAILLLMLAQVTGLKAHELIMSLGDTHIYNNHFDAVDTQLAREPLPWTQLVLNPEVRESLRMCCCRITRVTGRSGRRWRSEWVKTHNLLGPKG
jgi:thymidylate synthase